MKIKVGQWVRLKRGNLKLVTKEFFKGMEYFEDNLSRCADYDITAVANTPQELIKKGDLVFITKSGYSTIVKSVSNGNVWTFKGVPQYLEWVTKIFTPNSNGDFIKQWEANE